MILVYLVLACVVAAMGLGAWFGRKELLARPISSFALLMVAIISGYVMWMGWIHTTLLASADWCGKAIQAERITPGNSFQGLTACVELLKVQVQAEATNSHIYAGSIAGCMLALVVIVVARGRLAAKGPGDIEIDVSGNDTPAKAADTVANAAVGAAEQVKAETLPGTAPPVYNGPAMPPPPPKAGG